MPLPTLVFLAFGIGLSAALLGAAELRISPRHALFSSSFRAFALFLVLLLTMLNTIGVSAGVRLLLTGLVIIAVPVTPVQLLAAGAAGMALSTGYLLQQYRGAVGALATAASARAATPQRSENP